MNKEYYEFALKTIRETPVTVLLSNLREHGFRANLILNEDTLKTQDRIVVEFGEYKIEGTVIGWLNLNEVSYLSDNGRVFVTHYLQITKVNGVVVNESI